MTEKNIEKIKKLLALSHSSNEHEAEAALAQAMKFARKHDIDLEQIKGTEFDEKIEEEDVLYRANFSQWERYLFDGVAREFGCRILLGYDVDDDTYKLRRRIIMVGKKQDRQMAVYLATYLHRTVQRLYRQKKDEINERYETAFMKWSEIAYNEWLINAYTTPVRDIQAHNKNIVTAAIKVWLELNKKGIKNG